MYFISSEAAKAADQRKLLKNTQTASVSLWNASSSNFGVIISYAVLCSRDVWGSVYKLVRVRSHQLPFLQFKAGTISYFLDVKSSRSPATIWTSVRIFNKAGWFGPLNLQPFIGALEPRHSAASRELSFDTFKRSDDPTQTDGIWFQAKC